MEAGDDDGETFQPHADVHEQRENEEQPDIVANAAEPEELNHARG